MTNPYAPPPPSQQGGPRSPLSEAGRNREQEPEGPSTSGRGGPDAPRRRPSPQETRTTTRRVLAAAGCALGALVTTALPLPWPALGVLFSLGALVLGMRALFAVRAANLTRSLMPVVAMTLVVGLLYLLASLGVVATWELQEERQGCLEQALTVSARDSCESAFREGLDRLRPDLS